MFYFFTFVFLFTETNSAMDQVMQLVEPAKTFAKDSLRLVKRCTKPDRKGKLSFLTICYAIISVNGVFPLYQTTQQAFNVNIIFVFVLLYIYFEDIDDKLYCQMTCPTGFLKLCVIL